MPAPMPAWVARASLRDRLVVPGLWAVTLFLPLFALGYALAFLGYRMVQTGAISSGGSLSAMPAQACDPSCVGQPYEASHEIFLLFCSPQVPLSALLAFGVTWGVVALLRRLVPGKCFLG
ncbi:MAG: hypothetical protein ACI4P8_02370 [Akkermansia sp.]